MPSCSSPSCACNPDVASPPAAATAAGQTGETVRLPQRSGQTGTPKPIWHVESAETTPSYTPPPPALTGCQLLQPSDDLDEKCDKAPGAVCCKDQVQPQRRLVSQDVVRDVVIGLSDGLMVPFALTAGLSSLGSSKLVYQGGFAELISGAISMGIGGYLAAKAEQDAFRHKYAEYVKKLSVACDSETSRAVHDVLAPLGIKENVSKVLARNLALAAAADESAFSGVEELRRMSTSSGQSTRLSGFKHRLGWRKTEHVPTTGTTAFLLKFGEGMEEVPQSRLFASALTIGFSYFIGGLIPIIPYLCVKDALHGLYWSILATGVILLLFGWTKAWYTGAATGIPGLMWGALSTLAVGGAAAAASYGVVKGLEQT